MSTPRVERRRWGGQTGERVPGRGSRDDDKVMKSLAERWRSDSPNAARCRVRRALDTIRDYADVCHQHEAGHRLIGFASLAIPPQADQLDNEDWLEHGAADQLEDTSREELHLAPNDERARARYKANLAREISEKIALYRRLG
jgi:hypothetical protein